MRGNPSGNFVPECEPRKGSIGGFTELDAASNREDSAGSSDTGSLVLDSTCYTKVNRIVQEGNKKSYEVRRALAEIRNPDKAGATILELLLEHGRGIANASLTAT
jgi:hypothetical protein